MGFAIDVSPIILFPIAIFHSGVWGVLTARKNIIVVLIAIELMLLSITIDFVFFSSYLDDIAGQIYSLMLLTVAGSESALGLALIVCYYRVKGSIDIEFINTLRL